MNKTIDRRGRRQLRDSRGRFASKPRVIYEEPWEPWPELVKAEDKELAAVKAHLEDLRLILKNVIFPRWLVHSDKQ